MAKNIHEEIYPSLQKRLELGKLERSPCKLEKMLYKSAAIAKGKSKPGPLFV